MQCRRPARYTFSPRAAITQLTLKKELNKQRESKKKILHFIYESVGVKYVHVY